MLINADGTESGAGGPGTADADLIKETSTASFMADVIEASATVPVIVDFWAPWCGPCKQLGPALEKVVREARGAVRLVKIDIDQNPEIAQQMRVQSIPAVFAFKDGRPVDGFAGAVPESQIREFVTRLAGDGAADSPLTEALAAAEDMVAAQDYESAAGLFKQILQHDPSEIRAIAGLAACLVATGAVDEARALVDGLAPEEQKKPEIQAILARIELAAEGASAGDIGALQARVEGNPRDLAARLQFAMALYGRGDGAGAVDQLLESIRIDRAHDDEAARKQLVKLFEAFGHGDALTIDARKRLSAILFS